MKKCKFDGLKSFIKTLILNASSKCRDFTAPDPTDELRQLMNCTTIAQSQLVLNQLLYKLSVHINVPLSYVTSLTSGNWVIRGSTDPGSFSILLLGQSIVTKSSLKTSKANLKLRLQESRNNELTDKDIDTLITYEFA